MENVLKGLPDKISCPDIIHKCTSNVHRSWRWYRFHVFPIYIFFCSRDPSFMSLIDSPLFVKFSKMSNFNFRESWFGFFLFSEIHAMRGSKDLYSRVLGGIGKGSEGQTQLQYFLTLPWKMSQPWNPSWIQAWPLLTAWSANRFTVPPNSPWWLVKTTTYGKNSFKYTATVLWNDLPEDFRKILEKAGVTS
jgi:hypothetical protein